MTMLRSGYPRLTDQDYKTIFFRALGSKKFIGEKFLNMMSSEDKYEKMSGVSGLGLLTKKNEGSNYTADELIALYNKTFTHDTWGGKVVASWEFVQDDRSGKTAIFPAMFGDSMIATQNQEFANILDRGNDTSYTGPDSVVLFATTHPFNPGTSSTWANRPTTNADFSLSELEDMCARMWALKNPRQIADPRELKHLVAHPNNKVAIEKALGTQKITDSMNNDKNVVSTYGIDFTPNPFMTDTDAFIGFADKKDHQLIWIWRYRPDTQNFTEQNGDVVHIARARWSSGWVDARGIDGSMGI